MKRTLITLAAAAAAAVALSGCDRIVGDQWTPRLVQGPDRKPAELQPGLYRTVPAASQNGCKFALLRNGIPVQWAEVHDQVAAYLFLPESTRDTTWSMTTTGCGTWVRVP